jgi:hypothetical protein
MFFLEYQPPPRPSMLRVVRGLALVQAIYTRLLHPRGRPSLGVWRRARQRELPGFRMKKRSKKFVQFCASAAEWMRGRTLALPIEMNIRALTRIIGLITPVFWPPMLSARSAEAKINGSPRSFLEDSRHSRRECEFKAHSGVAVFGVDSSKGESTSLGCALMRHADSNSPCPGVSVLTQSGKSAIATEGALKSSPD